MSIFSRSNSLSQYLMKTQTSSRDQHLGSCPRPPGSWVLSWSESRGEGERGLPAPVPPPRGLKGLGYRHKNSGEKGSGGWGGGAPVPLSEIGGTFMPVKVKVKLVSVHFLYTNSLRQGPMGPSSWPRGLFIIRWSANVNSTRRNDSVVKSSRRRRWRHRCGLNDNQETASLSFRGQNLWNPWYCRTPDNLPYQPHPLDPTSKVSLAILVAPIRLLEKNSKKKVQKIDSQKES